VILIASQRGNAAQLSRHLLNARDNEHVELHEVRGFVADDLEGALMEAEAVSNGTRCKKFLLSVSFNPPKGAEVPTENFEAAIEMAEQKLGLEGQPRAIVFHEKEGRRHAHVVWSRIDARTMTARQLPYYKHRLMDVARELFLEHGWDMPKGLLDRNARDPLNYSYAEWQQAKRMQQDPRLIKAVFQQCWSRSDSARALRNALEPHGYFLCRGDHRGFVALNVDGKPHAISKWAGVKAKKVRERLGDARGMSSIKKQGQ